MSAAADDRLIDESQTQQVDMQLVTTQGAIAYAKCGSGQWQHRSTPQMLRRRQRQHVASVWACYQRCQYCSVDRAELH